MNDIGLRLYVWQWLRQGASDPVVSLRSTIGYLLGAPPAQADRERESHPQGPAAAITGWADCVTLWKMLSEVYIPDPQPGGRLLHNLLLFGRVCNRLGMDAAPGRMIEAARAVQLVDLGKRSDVYHALRALIVTRRADLQLFDEAFRVFWKKPSAGWTKLDLRSLGEERRRKKTRRPPLAAFDSEDSDDPRKEESEGREAVLLPVYSVQEMLRHKDFADMTGEEVETARRMIAALALSLALRRSRRSRPGRRGEVDARRLLRHSLRHGGETLLLPRKSAKFKPRRLALIADISGSMENYTRLLLHFMHTLSSYRGHIESFVFATRLTRITLPLRHKSVDRSLGEVGSSVRDWGGGTRIGEAVREFNYRWSRRVLGWGAVTLLITDGWDRGDPQLLGREACRLQRSCHRFIWLNPLLGRPGYQPLTRGAQALLPSVDDHLPVHNLASLEALARVLSKIDWGRGLGGGSPRRDGNVLRKPRK